MDVMNMIAARAAAFSPQETGDYRENGLLFCGKCGTAKQTRLRFSGRERVVGCVCRCRREQLEQEEAERKERDRVEKICQLRSLGLLQQHLNARFEEADGKNSGPMRILKNYAEHWGEMQRENAGLLLYGGIGVGKSFGAACVANFLTGECVPVLFTNLASVLNALGGYPGEDKNRVLQEFVAPDLLILDDFGSERNSEYALEQVYNLVNARYISRKPMIVTSNLSLQELRHPADLAHARIFDRILQMCVPVDFGNHGRRAAQAEETRRRVTDILRP